jgi:hypothetical protein
LPGLVDWTIRMIVDAPLPVLLETLTVNADVDMRAVPPKIQVPAVIVQGLAHPRRLLLLPGARADRAGAPSPVSVRDGPDGYSLPLTPVSRWLLGSHVRLAGPAPRSLARHDRAPQEELAAPDAPGLPPLQRSGEAGGPRRALPAQSLGRLHLIRRLGEEQLRVIRAGQVRTEARDWQ